MLIQILLGSALMIATILIAGASFWVMEALFRLFRPWLLVEPHPPKLMVVVCAAALWVIGLVTVDVWLWALALRGLGIFTTMEAAVYFALVSFTTLGYGDVLLPQAWRILGGMAATNGLLMIGLFTALMIEVLRHLRHSQGVQRRNGG